MAASSFETGKVLIWRNANPSAGLWNGWIMSDQAGIDDRTQNIFFDQRSYTEHPNSIRRGMRVEFERYSTRHKSGHWHAKHVTALDDPPQFEFGRVLFFVESNKFPGEYYGFIAPDYTERSNETNVWFGEVCLAKCEPKDIRRGARVAFRRELNTERPRAVEVQLAEGD